MLDEQVNLGLKRACDCSNFELTSAVQALEALTSFKCSAQDSLLLLKHPNGMSQLKSLDLSNSVVDLAECNLASKHMSLRT